eukprot:5514761-Amphidinium_carterae.1
MQASKDEITRALFAERLKFVMDEVEAQQQFKTMQDNLSRQLGREVEVSRDRLNAELCEARVKQGTVRRLLLNPASLSCNAGWLKS